VSPRFSFSEVFLRTQSDDRLCVLAADSHPLAFAVLVERHKAALLRTAARVARPPQAEDVVQEALMRAWGALSAGTRVENIQGWLHQIVRNTALNHLARERRPAERLPDDLADPQRLGAALDERLLAHEMLALMAALPEPQRTALAETVLAGRSRQEIAADLGVSEGAVRQLVHRARSAVRLAMTAITPYPFAAWVARRGAGSGTVDRLAGMLPPSGSGRSGVLEALTAGSAAGGGVLLKGGAVVLAVGALGGGVAWHELTRGPAHHRNAHLRIVASSRRAEAVGRSSVATVAAADPVGVARMLSAALTTSAGTARTSRQRTRGTDRAEHSSSAGGTARGDGGDGRDGPAATTPPSTSGSSPSESGAEGVSAPISNGSSGDSIGGTSGPSEQNSTVGSGDSSGGTNGPRAPNTAAGSGDSSGGPISDATGITSTTASGGN
jgi:RNA polymerase sigma factor (sigma-70 family)